MRGAYTCARADRLACTAANADRPGRVPAQRPTRPPLRTDDTTRTSHRMILHGTAQRRCGPTRTANHATEQGAENKQRNKQRGGAGENEAVRTDGSAERLNPAARMTAPATAGYSRGGAGAELGASYADCAHRPPPGTGLLGPINRLARPTGPLARSTHGRQTTSARPTHGRRTIRWRGP